MMTKLRQISEQKTEENSDKQFRETPVKIVNLDGARSKQK